MRALDLLGRRWSLRVLWELRDGPLGARALRDRCDAMSTGVLYERLRELSTAGLVERTPAGDYDLTDIGRELGTAIAPLAAWSERWSAHGAPGASGAPAGASALQPARKDGG
jgi:DNA-binding HxlR family transcriptional regulator